MKTLAASTSKSAFDLKTESVLESSIDAVELTEEELEQVTGSWCGCGGWGGGWGGFGSFGWGGWGGGGGGGWGGWGGGWGGWGGVGGVCWGVGGGFRGWQFG